jgi:hypothetical protein
MALPPTVGLLSSSSGEVVHDAADEGTEAPVPPYAAEKRQPRTSPCSLRSSLERPSCLKRHPHGQEDPSSAATTAPSTTTPVEQGSCCAGDSYCRKNPAVKPPPTGYAPRYNEKDSD